MLQHITARISADDQTVTGINGFFAPGGCCHSLRHHGRKQIGCLQRHIVAVTCRGLQHGHHFLQSIGTQNRKSRKADTHSGHNTLQRLQQLTAEPTVSRSGTPLFFDQMGRQKFQPLGKINHGRIFQFSNFLLQQINRHESHSCPIFCYYITFYPLCKDRNLSISEFFCFGHTKPERGENHERKRMGDHSGSRRRGRCCSHSHDAAQQSHQKACRQSRQ